MDDYSLMKTPQNKQSCSEAKPAQGSFINVATTLFCTTLKPNLINLPYFVTHSSPEIMSVIIVALISVFGCADLVCANAATNYKEEGGRFTICEFLGLVMKLLGFGLTLTHFT